MGPVIGEILPLAIGVTISPLPIIAAILMLLSPHARRTSLGFLVGWLAGIVIAVTVFTLVSSLIPATDPSASQPIAGVIKIVLGVLLLLLAVKQWRSRPKPGEDAALPKWMAAIDTMTVGRGLALGFVLAAVNPKNLIMAASAGTAIGLAALDVGPTIVAIVIFTVIAGASVAVPVIAYLVASDKLSATLESLRVWLVGNNAAIMAVLLLVIGVSQIGKGIGSF
ncbi:GAP family protein [Lysinibacter cavernae]|uniref:Threonine/homoserine/homoserine lactone efflux protein n=1 Tax=Lysinibacter cavernae TaxID=1640652 RepID=A0A7X5QZ49_9MICO|nr:GAP family protein [Lysinibacter cavernae]NIH52609.1 threonine/homoserine/homoserine lactone efflux protein [Lysinibacter cavernae]